MLVFLDTSILISYFRLSKSDFSGLEKLISGSKTKKFTLIHSDHGIFEYERYREKAISDGLRHFSADTVKTLFPPFVRKHDQAQKLAKQIKELKVSLSEFTRNIIDDSQKKNLLIDDLIEEIFKLGYRIEITDDIRCEAEDRASAGNPPRKRTDNIGDCLNWEALLTTEKKEDLAILSEDGDYFSDLYDGKPKEFLINDWKRATKRDLYCYRTISSFLAEHAPDLEPGHEQTADFLVRELEGSNSFKRTHEIVEQLRSAKGLNPLHVERIVRACEENDQISLIVGDNDIQLFLADLYEGFAGSLSRDVASELYELLGGGWV